jgi:heme/copper-type cytochrome/quinol oxidase subunit 1
MNKLKNSYFLFFCTAVLILIVGMLFFRGVFNVNIHDTYIFIDQVHITLLLTVSFLIVSGIYFSFSKCSKPLNPFFGNLHYLTTMLSLIVFVFPPTCLFEVKRYSAQSRPFANEFDINDLLAIFGLLFILAQLIFIINIVCSLLRRKS